MTGPYREDPSCDHGVEFDSVGARVILESQPETNLSAFDREVFLVQRTHAVRRRWPRLDGACPLGCGYVGIAYASHEHMIMGDW